MLTRRLWSALNHPPATHPLFWLTVNRHARVYDLDSAPGKLSWMDRLSIGYLVVFVGAMFLTNMTNLAAQSALLTLVLVLLALPIILPIFLLLRSTILSGSAYGLIWAADIGERLVSEQKNRTYDLLCLFPPGGLAASWAICTGCLYRKQVFQQVLEMRVVMLRAIIAIALLVFINTLSSSPSLSEIIVFFIQTAVLIAALHVDFVHSVVLGSLVGMVIPLYSTSQLDARLWTTGVFLTLQIFTYLIAAFMGLVIAPGVFEPQIAGVGVPVITLLALYSTREMMVLGLWRWLLSHSNTSPQDLEHIFRFSH